MIHLIHQLVYVSSAESLFSKVELAKLLQKSRVNNTRLGVTGMLLYKDGNFIQVLEGEKETVMALYEKIGADARHKGIMVLLNRSQPQRDFPDWSMGFRDLRDPEVTKLEGYNEFLNVPFTALRGGVQSHKLLAIFKAKM